MIERLAAGESQAVLSREIGVNITSLRRWLSEYRRGGAQALRTRRGRPSRAETLAMQEKRVLRGEADDLTALRMRVDFLECELIRLRGALEAASPIHDYAGAALDRFMHNPHRRKATAKQSRMAL